MAAIKPNPCSCIICHQETSQLGIKTHFLRKHTDSDKWNNSVNAVKLKAAELLAENKKTYLSNPLFCNECNKVLSYAKRLGKFCNHSCAASFANKHRAESGWVMSDTSKHQIRDKLIQPDSKSYKNKQFKNAIAGEYSKIYYCTCKQCNKQWINKTAVKTCFECKKNYYRGIDLYRFKFNIYNYPNLFDLTWLNSAGWYSQGGKSRNPYNPTGLSRDHRVSTSEALANNYDHYYITHPINCELMTQSKNSSKNGNSSITYEELIRLVDLYDGVNDRTCTG